MKLLIIGGTRFLGRHIAIEALSRGHELTLFHRGNTEPPDSRIERIIGDRLTDLDRLSGRRWDAVIDTCGYFPRALRLSAGALRDSCDHYTFISTISVYKDVPVEGTNESGALGTIDDATTEEITGESYGPLKVLCEEALEELMPGLALHVRSGLLVGPDDPTDRFTWWPWRIRKGGDVLAPGDKAGPVQLIDVRDMAAWVVASVESKRTGIFNVTGPVGETLTMESVLRRCRKAIGSDARLEWVAEEFLVEKEVGAFVEMPLWIPREGAGFSRIDVGKATAAGLATRPLEVTVSDTLAWLDAMKPAREKMRAGLDPEKERRLLDEWRARDSIRA